MGQAAANSTTKDTKNLKEVEGDRMGNIDGTIGQRPRTNSNGLDFLESSSAPQVVGRN